MRNSKKLVANWSTDEGSGFTNISPYLIGREKLYEGEHIANVSNLKSFLFDVLHEKKFTMTRRRYKILSSVLQNTFSN